jgi:hypothetical protein
MSEEKYTWNPTGHKTERVHFMYRVSQKKWYEAFAEPFALFLWLYQVLRKVTYVSGN